MLPGNKNRITAALFGSQKAGNQEKVSCFFVPVFVKCCKEIMMEFLLHYCNETGAILIAEGIETEAELECLCRLGVHYGQGYFLGRPDRTFKNVRNEAMLVLRRLNNKS